MGENRIGKENLMLVPTRPYLLGIVKGKCHRVVWNHKQIIVEIRDVKVIEAATKPHVKLTENYFDLV